jgi:pseudaminic acid biosynthesis-associated methylase
MPAEAAMSLWASKFGDEYTQRPQTSVEDRIGVWASLIPYSCQSILEVGANVGANLEAIGQFSEARLYATEPNDEARKELYQLPLNCVTPDYADMLDFPNEAMDLVFTSGVLIHVPPDKLIPSMREIHRVSRRWIIAAEYFAPQEEMIPYRGTKDTLWRRDYGSLYLDTFSDLQCLGCLFAWKRITGLDNLTFWVFEKGPKRH